MKQATENETKNMSTETKQKKVLTPEQKQAMQDARKAKAKSIPENETGAQKFQRLANKRVNKTLKAIDGVINLTGNAYESTPEQRAKILTVLNDKIALLIAAFDKQDKAKATFTL